MRLSEMTWPKVDEYLRTKNTILIPVGSTEQHGPTGLLGIDFISSQRIAEEVGRRSDTLVCPVLPYGMAQHHMAFSGTVSLTPLTYVAVLKDIIQSLVAHGFRRLIFVNGHGGNIAPITTAFSETLAGGESHSLELINWWHLPEGIAYEKEVFGDENGFHATCGEISVTMHTEPEAYARIGPPTFEPTFEPTAKDTPWPLSSKRFRELFPDGRMGSNPALANPHHGKILFEKAVGAILKRL